MEIKKLNYQMGIVGNTEFCCTHPSRYGYAHPSFYRYRGILL